MKQVSKWVLLSLVALPAMGLGFLWRAAWGGFTVGKIMCDRFMENEL